MTDTRHLQALAESAPHGTRSRYVAGCRCPLCKAANAEYARARAKAQRRGGQNPLVCAQPARQHLIDLSEGGVGARAIAAATDLARSLLQEIKAGSKAKIRRSTETKILAVTPEMASDGAHVFSEPALDAIAAARRVGITKRAIARAARFKHQRLPPRRSRMTARTVYRITGACAALIAAVPPRQARKT